MQPESSCLKVIAVGQGDKKIPYRPDSKPVRCDISGKTFYHGAIRECRDEAVTRRYGVGGVAHVSVWVCRKCRHAIQYKYHGGLGCELETGIPERKTGNVG